VTATPSLPEQARLLENAKAVIVRTLVHLTGTVPSDDQAEALARAGIADLHENGGRDAIQRLLELVPFKEETHQPEPASPPSPALQSSWLSASQLKEAESALWFATTHGVESLLDALQWYAKHRHGALIAPTIERCAAEFQLAKRAQNLRVQTLRNYRCSLHQFVAQLGSLKPIEVTPRMITDYLLRIESPSTRRAHWCTLHTFFRWLIVQRHAIENPVVAAIRRPRVRRTQRFILTVEEVQALLYRVKGTDTIGYWVLALFSGLRASEIARIQQSPDPWEIVSLRRETIEVSAAISKTCSRIIRMPPVLRRWLEWLKPKGLPFFVNHKVQQSRTILALLSERNALRHPLRVAGKDMRLYNIARRTYVSYRLALPGASYADVSHDCGNREAVLRRFYRQPATQEDAERFFSLTPDIIET